MTYLKRKAPFIALALSIAGTLLVLIWAVKRATP